MGYVYQSPLPFLRKIVCPRCGGSVVGEECIACARTVRGGVVVEPGWEEAPRGPKGAIENGIYRPNDEGFHKTDGKRRGKGT